MVAPRKPIVDITVDGGDWPSEDALRSIAERAVEAALRTLGRRAPARGATLGILFTDDSTIRKLNARWRGKDKPTNVLSFPQPGPKAGGPLLLGDIVLAAETLRREAALAEMPLEDHTAHLIVHGFLHLLGYDHEVEAEAEEMEGLERAALSRIGISDPTAAARRR